MFIVQDFSLVLLSFNNLIVYQKYQPSISIGETTSDGDLINSNMNLGNNYVRKKSAPNNYSGRRKIIIFYVHKYFEH